MSKFRLGPSVLKYRMQSMFDLVRETLGITLTEDSKNKWKGTIGLVGLDPNLVSELNVIMVTQANKLGLIDDQQIPEIISIGIPTKDIRLLENQLDVCKTGGADVIAFAQNTATSDINSKLRNRFQIPVYSMTYRDSLKDLANRTLHYAVGLEHPKRPDIRYLDDEANMLRKIQEDVKVRNKRMKQTEGYGGFPALSDPFIGILGGAGPYASAQLSSMLAKEGTNYVHISSSSAPGKHLYEMGKGPSYVPAYRSTYEFLMGLGAHRIAVPCNTAHMRLNEFSNGNTDSIIDIRTSVLDVNCHETGFILLGTNRTVGVNCDGKVGLYEELRTKYPDQGPFYVPNEYQQSKILDAIFDVKAGQLVQAKKKITDVVSDLRSRYGKDLKVILGCTELPLPFTNLELAELSLIDPAYNLAKVAKQSLATENVRRHDQDLSEKSTKTSPEDKEHTHKKAQSPSTGVEKISKESTEKLIDKGTTQEKGQETGGKG